MSVSDPLLRELKGYSSKFLQLHEKNQPITDANTNLVPFENCLENIFYLGNKSMATFFGYKWCYDPWTWILKTPKTYEFSERLYQITDIIDNVKQRRNVYTNDGRFRLFVRYCLVRKCLHLAIEELLAGEKCDKYYLPDAIVRDEILGEILLSVLLHCSKINFRLDLENSSLLDLSWVLPKIIPVEVVPTRNLGISVVFSGERAIILKIRSNSVSSERYEIQIGDVIESLNDMIVNATTQGNFNSMMKSQRGKPITLSIVKATCNYNNIEFHPAFVKLYKDKDIDLEYVRKHRIDCNYAPSEFNIKQSMPDFKGYKVHYMGSINVGRMGDVKIIDRAYSALMTNSPTSNLNQIERKKIEVHFKIGELGVKYTNVDTKTVVDHHSFMEISACGGVTLMPHYFSYIGGKEHCNICKNFKCFFFLCPTSEMAATILEAIGEGFQRTHFAV